MYMMVYLLKGSLPWSNLQQKYKDKPFEFYLNKRYDIDQIEQFMKMTPKKFRKEIKNVLMLQFDEKPDYDGLIKMFKTEINVLQKDIKSSHEFEWVSSMVERSNASKQSSYRRQHQSIMGMSNKVASYMIGNLS